MPRWFLSIEEMQSEKRYPDIPKDIWRSKHPAGPLVEMTLVSKRQVRAPTNKTRQKHTKTTNLSKWCFFFGKKNVNLDFWPTLEYTIALLQYPTSTLVVHHHPLPPLEEVSILCLLSPSLPPKIQTHWTTDAALRGWNLLGPKKKTGDLQDTTSKKRGILEKLNVYPSTLLWFFLLSFIKFILFFSNVFPLAKWQHGILHGWYSIHHQSQQKYVVALMIFMIFVDIIDDF